MCRIAVVATSCSGKTTLATQLASRLEIPHIELDAIHWGPNWTPAEREPFRRAVEAATIADRWVVDGNYKLVRDIVWERATHVIWLNFPFHTVFHRALVRTLRRVFTQEELFAGNRESFRRSFLSRDSILWWVITSHRRRQREYRQRMQEAQLSHLHFLEVRAPAQAQELLRTFDPAQ